METVKQFIEKISSNKFYGNDVRVLTGEDRTNFVNEWLRKLETLAVRKNKEIDIDFLRENLDRNVKYIVNVNYTDEEKKLGKQSNSYCEKQNLGARPGQYCQGRIVYSNISNEILKDHETTHAARIEIFNKNGEYIVPADIVDELPIVTNTPAFLKQIPNNYSTAGYDKSEVDENGNYTGEQDKDRNLIGPPEPLDFVEMSDLMEICTESIAGMMNEPDEKTFENYSIPTSKMSAISFYRQTRDLLIMAIGSDDFIFDMLSRDSSNGITKLNNRMQMYKDDASIVEYLKIAGEYALCQGRIDRGIENDVVEKRRDEYLQKMEEYVTDIFSKRMETGLDKDKSEQINYFCSRLQTKEAKDRLQRKINGKSGLDDCMKDDTVRTSTAQKATKFIKETVLGKEKVLDETEQQK